MELEEIDCTELKFRSDGLLGCVFEEGNPKTKHQAIR